jgi:hypothetical protein
VLGPTARCPSQAPQRQDVDLFAPLSCSLALLHKSPQVLDVARGSYSLVGKLSPDGEAIVVDRRVFESLGSTPGLPGLLPPALPSGSGRLGRCGAVRRAVVVKLDAQSRVHGDVELNLG